jgi:DNA-binding SARP family transcriptional activator
MAIIRKEYSQALYEGKRALDFASKTESLLAIVTSQLLLAQLFWIMGKREAAREYLEQVSSYAVQKDTNYVMSMALMNEAQFAFDEGDDTNGFLLLSKSMSMAREGGHAFCIADNPSQTMKMCQKALEAGIEVEHVREFIRRRGFVPEKPPVHLENWPWAVKIYTMGRFAVLINDAPLASKRKVQQMPLRLLKAVIALGCRDIACDKLLDLLWPDAAGDAAHHTLETTLQRLRKLLGYPEAIDLTDGKITLDNRYCWVDAWAFERLLGQTDACKASEPLKKKELIEKAITLYNGSFLSGEREEPWMISSSEYLKSKYFKSIWWLVNYMEEQGQWEQAADLCEKFLKVDACREDIYRKLMICHNKMERKNEALLVYQRCCKTLSAVLGISPSGETQAIYKAILAEKN